MNMRKTSFVLAIFLFLFACLPCGWAQNDDPVVVMQTTKGPIVMRIFVSMVPNTAHNFLDLVRRGFYNGLIFHRIETWCIQGGDPYGNGTGDFIDPTTNRPRRIRLEINNRLRHNGAGVVAMARTDDPDSASCQFYITKAPTSFLDGKYAIFGQVLEGMDAVHRMQRGDRIISAKFDAPQPQPQATPTRSHESEEESYEGPSRSFQRGSLLHGGPSSDSGF